MTADIWIYLLEPGDEFFLHFDYWPDPMPSVFRIKDNIKSQDVAIKKQETHVNNACKPIKEGTYVGT